MAIADGALDVLLLRDRISRGESDCGIQCSSVLGVGACLSCRIAKYAAIVGLTVAKQPRCLMSRFLAILALLLAGCGSSSVVDLSKSETAEIALLRETISEIRVEAGVGYDGAVAIARYYLLRVVRRSGTAARASDRGRYWEVLMLSGRLRDVKHWIYIDKKSGRVSSSFRLPTFENLEQLLAE